MTPFRTLKIHQIRPKIPSQNASKTASHLTMPEILKNATLPYENLIFDVSRPSKIVPKSMPKRFQNQLYLGYPLGTLKNTIFDVKTSPRWTPKISVFFVFKNRQKILALTVFGPRCLLEASKRPPRPSQEPPRATQEPPRAAQEPPTRHLTTDLGAS